LEEEEETSGGRYSQNTYKEPAASGKVVLPIRVIQEKGIQYAKPRVRKTLNLSSL